MLAGIGSNVSLVSNKLWAATPSIPPPNGAYLACIVKAEADQQMNSSENANGFTVHAVACAQPANVRDPRPAPGALSFDFPDGMPPEMLRPSDMLTDNPAAATKARVLNDAGDQAAASFSYSSGGDFPVDGSATIADYAGFPSGLTQNTGNVFRLALYDWWKRAGVGLDVTSAVKMMSPTMTAFTTPNPAMVAWKTNASTTDPTGLSRASNASRHTQR